MASCQLTPMPTGPLGSVTAIAEAPGTRCLLSQGLCGASPTRCCSAGTRDTALPRTQPGQQGGKRADHRWVTYESDLLLRVTDVWERELLCLRSGTRALHGGLNTHFPIPRLQNLLTLRLLSLGGHHDLPVPSGYIKFPPSVSFYPKRKSIQQRASCGRVRGQSPTAGSGCCCYLRRTEQAPGPR